MSSDSEIGTGSLPVDPPVQGEEESSVDLILFQTRECYVYKIPPRKSAASYRADEWDINKWTWEGCLKVIARGSQCTIRLEDVNNGELFAQAPVRHGQPIPVEAVIDSSRFFVLRIEDTSGGPGRHAFIGIGFRERTLAYDFQAALYDHMKYLNKKKEAEEMEEEYKSKPAVDYSLKEGQTIHLDIKSRKSDSPKQSKRDGFASGVVISPPPPTKQGEALRRASGEGAFPVPFLPPPPAATLPPILPPPPAAATPSSLPAPDAAPSEKVDPAIGNYDFGDFQTA
eukprot:TRINITY_DN8042_c0_g1_i1.p1 TRINITY_DN8042_c0_g1~~TRINITY_DN8042_c0_g1_i1.p1  ORF type:complete len:284 (-),score=53.83 TRINITY_DN8042_c0_g1_i1:671-1522(-)